MFCNIPTLHIFAKLAYTYLLRKFFVTYFETNKHSRGTSKKSDKKAASIQQQYHLGYGYRVENNCTSRVEELKILHCSQRAFAYKKRLGGNRFGGNIWRCLYVMTIKRVNIDCPSELFWMVYNCLPLEFWGKSNNSWMRQTDRQTAEWSWEDDWKTYALIPS